MHAQMNTKIKIMFFNIKETLKKAKFKLKDKFANLKKRNSNKKK